ncbi:hypothetical protein QYF36_006965 [Acer negundo]|nr:hypothetical protein QYF36_006965 [Acer negundo]
MICNSIIISMDSKASTTVSPSQNQSKPKNNRDFLNHLEAYLAKRDGIHKLLQISSYVTKIILASSVLPQTLPLTWRLKSFESSVGMSRKAFKLGKFIQPINDFRNSRFESKQEFVLSAIASVGDSLSLFLEQFIWLAKSGAMDDKHLHHLEKISAWADLIGHIINISLTLREWIAISKESSEHRIMKKMKLMKKLSIFQDLSGLLIALADIRDGKGRLSSEPLLLASAGLFSALITTHKIWTSC